LVNVGGFFALSSEEYVKRVHQALETVLPTVRHQKPLFGRCRPLVATPVLGIGGGGLENIGRAVYDILTVLYTAASKEDIDFALVTLGEERYAAAQFHRGHYFDNPWPSLIELQREHADRLVQRAADGRLALFLGAGVSQNAGLPGWGGCWSALPRKPLCHSTI
jgi:hypothetical protein